MADNTVKFTINLGGNAYDGVLKLDTAVSGVTSRVDKLKAKFETIGKIGLGLSGVINVLGKIKGKFDELTAANSMQQEAEAKLAQVMRNTMGATVDQIQSIKDLAAAQQQLGVIGDEVQLAGAQELGTYLEKTESLQRLLPVMNDMLAQQYGLNASQEQAVTIGSMMGKVMEGQVGALSRYGYKFDEAQEKILKYGTEEEKVATLAEVISQSVGGMNEALANTPEGQLKQVANAAGDIKERLGSIIVRIEAKLVPVMNATLNIVNHLINGAEQLFSFVSSHMPALLGLGGTLGLYYGVRLVRRELQKTSLAALFSGGSFKAMATLAKSACTKISIAISSIPIIGWIAAGIAVVIEVVQQLWDKCEGFRALVFGIWEVIKAVFGKIVEWAGMVWDKIVELVKTLVGHVTQFVSSVWNRIKNMINWIKGIFQKVGAWFKRIMQPVWDWFSNLWGHVKAIIDRVVEWMGKVFDPIIELWNYLTGSTISVFSRGAQKGRDSFRNDHVAETETMDNLIDEANDIQDPTNSVVNNAGQTANATATGGTRNTTVNINLGKMVESIVFNGGFNENEQDMEQRLAAMLSRILGMAEATAG